MQRRIGFLTVLALATTCIGATEQSRGPSPPCEGTETLPAYPPPEAPPAVSAWRAADLARLAWSPPACTGWSSSSQPRLVVALTGTFRFKGDTAALLERIGAVSSLQQVRYWSITDHAWRPLAQEAGALSSSDPRSRRPDFSAAEFTQGSQLHYWITDSRTGPAVYRMRVLEREAERIVVASENVSPLRYLFFTLFDPGALQAVEFLERRGTELWQVYLLTRADQEARFLGKNQEASSINRLVALYRRLADIPSDQEPPARP